MVVAERTPAQAAWRERFRDATRTLYVELHDDAAYFEYHTRRDALERLMLVGLASATRVELYRAHYHTVFLPGLPALLVDEPGGWAALCSVSTLGRLATIDAVVTWEVAA